MRLSRFEKLIRSENAARRGFRARLLGHGHDRRPPCPSCGRPRPYQLREGRFRCGLCRYTFGLFTRRWLGQSRVPLRQWAWILKLFELEVTARQAAVQTGLSYPTVLRAFTLIRRAILAQADEPALQPLLTNEVELDESYFGPHRSKRTRGGKRGRGAPFKIPVFGILERRGRVTVSVVPDVTRGTLMDATLKLVKRGSLIYTDRWKGYDALTFCGYRHLRVDHRRRFSSGRVHINGLEGFWSYAKGKLIRHRGISPHRFPLYLYEMQFRYNHRTEDLFALFLDSLLQPVPTAL